VQSLTTTTNSTSKNKDRSTSHSGYDHGKVKTMSRQCQRNDKLAKVPTKIVRVQDNATTTFDVNNQNNKENEQEPESFNLIALSGFQMRQMRNGQMVRNSGKQVFTEPWY
jgi:hypothetical protein